MISPKSITRLNILIGLSALIAIFLVMNGQTNLFIVAKPLTTCLIIGLFYGLISEWSGVARLFLAGLIFCLAGDVFLLNDDYFIYGLSAFFVAHACFLVAFVAHDGTRIHTFSAICLLAISIAYFSLLLPKLGPLTVAVGVYFSIILLMTIKGVSMALFRADRSYTLLAIAAILFMLSDSVIGFNKFILAFTWSPVVILSTYWLSIALLANAAASISRRHNTQID